MSDQSKSSSKTKPVTLPKTPTTRSKNSKLSQVATQVVNEQLGITTDKTTPTPPPTTPTRDDQEPIIKITDDPEKLISDEDTSDEIDPAIVTLAKTELQIEKAKGKNMRDEIALLAARMEFRKAMGDESWADFKKRSDVEKQGRNKMIDSSEVNGDRQPENVVDSLQSLHSFRPLQTSSRENTSFRSAVETKQTISQSVWFEGTITNQSLREELSEYAVDTLDGVIDWFKEGQNLVEKLLASGGQIWKAWVSKLIQLKIKVKKLIARYENKPEILFEVKTIHETMEFWYSHINSEAEIKGTFQFIASWGDDSKTRQIMGSNMTNDFKRALSVSRNDQREKFVHSKSTLQLRTMSSSNEHRSERSRGSNASSGNKEYYKNRDRSNNRGSDRRDYGKDSSRRDYRNNYGGKSYDRRDSKRGGDYDRRGGNSKQAGENTLPVKQF